MLKRIMSVFLITAMIFCCNTVAEEHRGIVILHTNDVHCGIEDGIGYAGLAAYRKAYEKLGYDVAIVDIGDAVQGAPIGPLSKGRYIIDIMNHVGYTAATLGNHEFDFGLEAMDDLRASAAFPYVAANYCDTEGNPVLDPYVIVELGGHEVAFVGVVTPEAFYSLNPDFFKDENGNYIYSFCQGENGALLHAAVQKATDAAIAEGADIVVALSHLGTSEISSPYTSIELIANTTGIDAILDGHSHSVWEQEKIMNKDGEEVILSSTGTKFEHVGALIIECEEGESGHSISMSGKLHNESLFQDAETEAFIGGIKAQYEEGLNEVIASTKVDLVFKDAESGKRLSRLQETNLGDLCADAYRSLLNSDIAFVNGGGIRANISAGDITYGQILDVHPYSNMACMIEVSGRDILDALEMGVRMLPDENGGFLQTSGLSYEINTAIESSVVLDDEGNFVEVAGERRIENVLVGGESIDPEKNYTLAGHNFMLLSGGDGYSMFKNGKLLIEDVMADNQVLINYIVEDLGGIVGGEYADINGQGRIIIK